jgi:hypothetical protein
MEHDGTAHIDWRDKLGVVSFQFSLYRVLTYGYEQLSIQSEHRSVSRSGSGDPRPAGAETDAQEEGSHAWGWQGEL